MVLLLNPKARTFVMPDDFLYLDVSDALSFQQFNGFRHAHVVQAVRIFTSAFLVDEILIHGKSAVKGSANHPVVADVHMAPFRPVACRGLLSVCFGDYMVALLNRACKDAERTKFNRAFCAGLTLLNSPMMW